MDILVPIGLILALVLAAREVVRIVYMWLLKREHNQLGD